MSKIAFVYPGQGAQYVGMGKEIADNFEVANRIFNLANEAIEFDIKKICFEGPEEELRKTENTQPAILTVSIAITEVLKDKGIFPTASAGLSLGEYTSLVLARAIDFTDAVALVKKRGRFMQEAVPLGVGTMAAVLGMERNLLEEAVQKAGAFGIVEAANFNSPGQIVISGEIQAVEKACEIAKEMGALKAVLLPVSAPFHSSMLTPAGNNLAIELEQIPIRELDIPVIANVNADFYKDSAEVKQLLIRQVSSPVLWEDSVLKMLDNDIDTFIEIGPGKTLSQFIKKILKKYNKKADIYNIEDMESLNNVIDTLSTK